MKRVALVLTMILASDLAYAQSAAATAPTGLVVGSGNYFSPIVADLEKAIAFYGAIGFQFQGEPSTADANPQLRAMFGLPDARLRYKIGGGAPIKVGTVGRMVVVQDPAGHFIEIVQPEKLTEAQAAAAGNVVGVRVRLTVRDVESALNLYRDALGFHELASLGQYNGDAAVLDALGLAGGQYRVGQLQVPTSGLQFTLIDFKSVERKTKLAGIKDPGSTRIPDASSGSPPPLPPPLFPILALDPRYRLDIGASHVKHVNRSIVDRKE
jgi:catechol 2,3-dioxygenase-like lactoylglutathione lyase family enzyme